MFGSNKPAYNKPAMKPMKPPVTGGPFPQYPKPMTGGFDPKPMKPSKNQQSLDAIKRRLQG